MGFLVQSVLDRVLAATQRLSRFRPLARLFSGNIAQTAGRCRR
jgi:hypothetical protein